MNEFKGTYTERWEAIAERIKAKNNYRCERCGEPNDKKSNNVLTVHHLDDNKTNNAEWNLAALCQRCHLHVQGKNYWNQPQYMPEDAKWMKLHLEMRNRMRRNEI